MDGKFVVIIAVSVVLHGAVFVAGPRFKPPQQAMKRAPMSVAVTFTPPPPKVPAVVRPVRRQRRAEPQPQVVEPMPVSAKAPPPMPGSDGPLVTKLLAPSVTARLVRAVTEPSPSPAPAPPAPIAVEPVRVTVTPLDDVSFQPPPVAAPQPPRPAALATRGANVSQPARPLPRNIPPSYPPASAARGHEGTVELQLHVSADGRVDRVRVIASSGHAALDAAAVAAARKWRFQPATSEGAPVASIIEQPVRFQLERK